MRCNDSNDKMTIGDLDRGVEHLVEWISYQGENRQVGKRLAENLKNPSCHCQYFEPPVWLVARRLSGCC